MARRRTKEIVNLSALSTTYKIVNSVISSLKRAADRRAVGIVALLFGVLGLSSDPALLGIAARAQAPSEPNIIAVPVPSADRVAAPKMTNFRCHILPIQTGY